MSNNPETPIYDETVAQQETLPDMPEPEPTGPGVPPEYPWHQRLKPYAKFLIALAGAVATAGATSFADSPEAVRWFGFVGSIVTALAVYFTPNKAPDGI